MPPKITTFKEGANCKPFVGRDYRIFILIGAAAYVIFLQPLISFMGIQLYVTIFIAAIVVTTILHLTRCDLGKPKKLLVQLSPALASIIMLMLYAIFFNSTSLELLGFTSSASAQAGSDLGNTFGSLWLLSASGLGSGLPASIAWVAYGPACLGCGFIIMIYYDTANETSIEGMGALLMAVPLVIDLVLNLTGTPAGLITDLIPALSYLPQGGMTSFLEMLLNLIPDVVLFAFLAGVAEESIAERYPGQ